MGHLLALPGSGKAAASSGGKERWVGECSVLT